MMKSMTGFGRAKYEKDLREYNIEIRTVNHKYNDISIKMPRSLNYLEDSVKKEIQNSVSRGKIEVYVSYANTSTEAKEIKINTELAKIYIQELKNMVEETNVTDNINIMDITKLPDVLNIQNAEVNNTVEEELKICLKEAIESLLKMRENEGKEIAEDLKNRINEISNKIDEISANSTRLVEEYIVKLESRINDLLKTDVVDQTRLAQEVVIFSDKCSVEEEITRLKSHIIQFLDLLKTTNKPIGKKLDFIVQEMNRETNTIGSKANNLEITKLVIDVKTEIENIREQIQNVE